MKKIIIIILLLFSLQTVIAYQLDMVNTDPAPLRSGTYGDVTVILYATHDEGVKENIEIKLVETQNIIVLGEQTKIINFLRPGDIYSRTYRIFLNENLPTAEIPIVFEIKDEDGLRRIEKELFVRRSETLPNINIGRIQTIPSDIIKDTRNNVIRIDIQNIGDKTGQLLRGRLIGSDIRETSAFTLQDSITELERGQSETLEFTFDLEDIKKETTPLSLILDYQIEDVHGNFKPIKQTLTFDLTLKKTPDVKIIQQQKLNKVLLGRNSNEIQITLENIGTEKAEDVRLRLYPDVTYPFDFSKTNFYVSSLMEPGETANIIIEFDVLKTGSVRNYPMNVEIESVVGTNRIQQKDRIDIDVTGTSMDMSQIIRNSMLIIAFIIALFFGYKAYKKNKSERNSGKTKDSPKRND